MKRFVRSTLFIAILAAFEALTIGSLSYASPIDISTVTTDDDVYRIEILDNALESTLMVLSNEGKAYKSALIISDKGYVVLPEAVEEGLEIQFKTYDSSDVIKGKSYKVISDDNNNPYTIAKIGSEYCDSYFSIGDSINLEIGKSIFSIPSDSIANSINVVEGSIARIGADTSNNVVDENDNLVYTLNYKDCFLYNGVSTIDSWGGPIIDNKGDLIGILLGSTGSEDNVNVALPIDQLEEQMVDVIK